MPRKDAREILRRVQSLLEEGYSDDELSSNSFSDPSTLCPWCSETLPENPTDTLLSMMQVARAKSRPHPRPGNALALKAKLGHHAHVCVRHRLELEASATAKANGWPYPIDFRVLGNRVQEMKGDLSVFIFQKDRSVFWQDLRDKIELMGINRALSIRSTYAFVDEQPSAG